MTLKQKFFSGPTLTQALLAAARHHSVNPDDLAYREIERKQGLKPSRTVVVEVDPTSPTLSGSVVDEPEAAVVPEPDESAAAPVEAVLADAEQSDEEAAAEEPTQQKEASSPEVELIRESEAVVEARAAEEPTAGEPEPEEAAPAEPAIQAETVSSPSWLPPAPVEDGEEAPPAWVVDPAQASERNSSDEAEPVATDRPSQQEIPESKPAVEVSSSKRSRGEPVVIDDDLRQAVSEAVDQLAQLAGLRVQVGAIENFEDGVNVELEGPDSERMSTQGGRALLAIQHLLPRLLFSNLGRALHCRVDTNGFHASRVERLEELAMKAAERVRSGGRSWLMDPMPPDERRLVHMALADEAGVETESVGKGFLKRVRVAQS